jgi:hypothetical protein
MGAGEAIRTHANKLMIGGAAVLLVGSVLTLGAALTTDGTAAAEAEADVLITQLEKDLEKADATLAEQHQKLSGQISGADAQRVVTDTALGRTAILSLVEPAGSSRTLHASQLLLDKRYDALDQNSRVLSGFLPTWYAATGAGQGNGAAYELTTFDVDVTQITGLDYSYVSVARLDRVEPDGAGRSEYVLFTFSTNSDGEITAMDAYRASSATRDAFVAATADEAETESADEPSN